MKKTLKKSTCLLLAAAIFLTILPISLLSVVTSTNTEELFHFFTAAAVPNIDGTALEGVTKRDAPVMVQLDYELPLSAQGDNFCATPCGDRQL